MVRKSRFLKQGPMPPSGSGYSSGYSIRSSSVAPSRDYRARSAVPSRASSMAPDSSTSRTSYRFTSGAAGRATSLGPDRYSTSYRASSCTPYRASSVAPVRASSVTPYSRSIIRASYVAPYSSSYRSDRASSLPPKSVSFRSTPLLQTRAAPRIDTTIPTRQFGTRLGVRQMETSVKPAIYDEYYGMTYIPSAGRDSWSAYRISDETLDDNDDLVYQSTKKDYEVMKRVNKKMVEAMSVPAPVFVPVAPAYRRFTPQQTKIIHVPVEPEINKSLAYQPAPVRRAGVYHETPPAVTGSYSTVYNGSDLLRAKNKSIACESVEFDQPATFLKLKERIREARANLDHSKLSASKNNNDPELRAIDAEVNAIRKAREMRAQSLEPEFNQAIEDRKTTSNLRKRIRSTLRSSKCGIKFM